MFSFTSLQIGWAFPVVSGAVHLLAETQTAYSDTDTSFNPSQYEEVIVTGCCGFSSLLPSHDLSSTALQPIWNVPAGTRPH